MTSFATIYTGGELAGVGMMQAGWQHLWGIEMVSAIAEVARINGFTVHVVDARCVDFRTLDKPSHLHCSPPCTRASVANSDATESPLDGELAESVCRAIRTLRPDTFSLENVYGYRKFKAYRAICDCLDACGYWWEHAHCNSADFAVPQTRKRLILRATLGDHLRPLPSPVPWVGWYAAIADLIDTLPESKFADWQLARLGTDLKTMLVTNAGNQPNGHVAREPVQVVPTHPWPPVTGQFNGRVPAFLCNESSTLEVRAAAEPAAAQVSSHRNSNQKAFLVDCVERDAANHTMRQADEPSHTITASAMRRPQNTAKAFLIDGKPANYDGDTLQVKAEASPTPPVTATMGQHPFRAFVVHPQDMRSMPTRDEDEPIFTITAAGGLREDANAGFNPRAWLSQGRVVAMTPRALARFQSIPDWYELPANKKLACTIIGNAVPPLMMQRIAESLTP